MNIHRGNRSLLAASIVAFGLASIVGCGGVVSRGGSNGGGGNDGSGGGDGGVATGGGDSGGNGGAGGDVGCDPGACPTPAFTMDTYLYSAMMGGDPPFPDIQHLLYGSGYGTPSCGYPHGDLKKCGGSTVDIMIATSKFAPGTYSFSDPDLDILIEETKDEGVGQCSGGAAGSFEEGTLVIHAIDDDTVTFSVEGVGAVLDIPVNGYFQATRCYLEY